MSKHNFCLTLLQLARAEAKIRDIKLPKKMTALRSMKDQWFVEAEGMKPEYISADCAYDARAQMIDKIIDKVGEQTAKLQSQNDQIEDAE
jgi:hypothetical protein